jgi:hypothetical protein
MTMKHTDKLKIYIAALLLLLIGGLTACSDSTDIENLQATGYRDVMLNFTVQAPSSRVVGIDASGSDSKGLQPKIQRVHAFFLNGSRVVKDGEAVLSANVSGGSTATQTATYKDIPSSVDKIYVLGYCADTQTSPDLSSKTFTSEDDVLNTLIEADGQMGVNSDELNASGYDPQNVNTFGSVDNLDFSNANEGDVMPVSIDMKPAVARIQIHWIHSHCVFKDSETHYHHPDSVDIGALKQPIDKFQLDAIYINNTYAKAALNGVTHSSNPADSLAYGGTDITATSPWGDPDKYYRANFFDTGNISPNVTPYGYDASKPGDIADKAPAMCWGGKGHYASSSSATNRAAVFAYSIVPLSAANGAKGTTINGEAQNVVPHIILKLSHIIPMGSTTEISGTMFLTIKNYKIKGTETNVTQFEAGKFYHIESLVFGLEDLSILPEVTPTDYTAELSVIDWTDGGVIEGEVD